MKTFSSSLPLASPYFQLPPSIQATILSPPLHSHFSSTFFSSLCLPFLNITTRENTFKWKWDHATCALNSSSFLTYCRKKSRLLGGVVKPTWPGHLLPSVVSNHRTICVHYAPATLAPSGFFKVYMFLLFMYLAASGLSHSMWDLLLKCTDSPHVAQAPEHMGFSSCNSWV